MDEVIADYDERSLSGALPPLLDTRSAARAVFDAVAGFGPLQPYLDDPLVEEIWINEPTKVFIARAGAHELTTTVLFEDQVRDLVEKMLNRPAAGSISAKTRFRSPPPNSQTPQIAPGSGCRAEVRLAARRPRSRDLQRLGDDGSVGLRMADKSHSNRDPQSAFQRRQRHED